MDLNITAKKAIKEIAKNKPNEEVCGFVYVDLDGNERVEACENESQKKDEYFQISPLQYKAIILKSSKIIGVFHSHIKGGPEPSEFDKVMVEHTQLPFIIYSVSQDSFLIVEPKCTK